jgi:ankyrin repeat protein
MINCDTARSELIADFTGYPEHMAVINNSFEELDIALAADDGDCDVEHHRGDTPLALAIRLHRTEIVDYLLAIGSPVNAVTRRGQTAGEVAARCGNQVIMAAFIQAGLNVQARSMDAHSTLCHFAAQNTDAGVLRLLIEAAAPFDERNSRGELPIDYAACNENEQVMSTLLAAGCSLESKRCALNAARNSNHMVLAMLIAAGADITACDVFGFAPIHYAACNPNVAVVRLLLDAGVNVNVLDRDGENPLFKACEKNPNMEVFDALLAAGVEWRDVAPRRNICHAVANNTNVAIVQRVIDRGVDLNMPILGRMTPVMIAARESTSAVVSLLLHAGADVHATASEIATRSTVCEQACWNVEHPGIMRLLIAAGAHVGVDVLSSAICRSNIDAVQALIDAGMNVAQEVNTNPLLLFDYVNKHTHQMLEFLMRHGVDFRALSDRGHRKEWHVSSAILAVLFARGADLNARFPDEQRAIWAQSDATATLVAIGVEPRWRGRGVFRAIEECFVSVVSQDSVPRRHVAWACSFVAQRQFELLKMRALQVCVGLHALHFPALVTCEILANAFAPLESLVAFHRVWAIVTTIKHFREQKRM